VQTEQRRARTAAEPGQLHPVDEQRPCYSARLQIL
jgi:hypothetical protein